MGVLLAGALVGFWGAVAANHLIQRGASRPVAELAPDFDIPLYGGEQHFQLSDYRGQGVVINFWASWCYPCREEMPTLEAAWRAYRDQGVVFVGVNVWDEEVDALDFLREFEVTYLVGPDVDEQVVELYRVQGVPTTVFVAPDGSAARKILGPLDPEMLAEAVEMIIP